MRRLPAANCASALSATAARDDDWDLHPPNVLPQRSNVLAHCDRPVQAQEAPRTAPLHGPQRVDESRSPPRNTQRAALPQRSNRITAGLSWQQHLGVAAETLVAEGEIINFDNDDAPQHDAAQQNVDTEWGTALAGLFLSETHRSVGENGFSSGNEPLSTSNDEKDTTASSELIIDTSDSYAPAPVVLPSPMQQRWAPVHRTGCVGVIWTKRSYQYLVYSPDLEGREAFVQVFVHKRKMTVGQWLRFDATLWKPEARYTIGRYTSIDEVIHAMPMLDSIVITCDVRVTGDANGERPLVESDFSGRVEDPYSLATRLRSGLHSVNLVYSNEQKAAATGRWSLCFVND
ncbi:hypothetical protein AAVH_23617 [Aphelenchoides avenae]|nr:hypothetical protein AAVH_23617 [Aphelenchus avenae]